MPRRRFRRVRAAVERLQPHPLHQRRDTQPTDHHALLPEQVPQHPAAGERIEQVQLVDPPHDGQVGVRHRPWQIVDAAAPGRPAAARGPGRSSLCARPQTGLPERTGQKIVRQCQLAGLHRLCRWPLRGRSFALRVQHRYIDRRLGHGGVRTEHVRGTLQPSRPPLVDEGRVRVRLRRPLGQRLLVFLGDLVEFLSISAYQ